MLGAKAAHNSRHEPFYWWFMPSWLGLDAPCVVLTWTWAVARSANVSLPARSAAALFLVVWFIYLSDRLFDVAHCENWSRATGRLRFGRDRRSLFWACLGGCGAGLLALLGLGLQTDVILRALAVALALSLHFVVFVNPIFLRTKLPGKEFGVGLFFALGAYACLGASWLLLPLFAALALVVAFNCLVIAARDEESDEAIDPGGASRWWRNLNTHLLWIGTALTLLATLISFWARETPFYLALAASLAALTALHCAAHRFTGNAVRALADFALLTPLPVFFLLA